MSQTNYERLTRPRRRTTFAVALVSRCSLWLGPDHLLHIDSNGYSESYRRFYFRDIQAITFLQTHSWIYQLLAFGFLAACSLATGLIIADPVAYWVFGIIAGLFSIGVVVNLIAGPTCCCRFQTAVQVEEIPSLNRIRKARRILNRIEPLIQQAQGLLTSAEAQQGINDLLAQNGTPVASSEPGLPSAGA